MSRITTHQRRRSIVTTSAQFQPDSSWSLAPVPAVATCQGWTVEKPAQLALARRDARHVLAGHSTSGSMDDAELVILVLDELASNALRHGVPPSTIELCEHADGWLVIATDAAADQLPVTAVDRPAERGGMGLRMIARLTLRRGTEVKAGRKYVWAVVGS